MATQQKIDSIVEFKQKLEESQIAIATRYIGINAGQVTDLRKQLRDAGIEYKVFKNNLAQRGLDELGYSDAAKFMEGPTAWAFSMDPVAPAKILKNFHKTVPVVEMAGGILEGRMIEQDQLNALADLPSREQLLAQVCGAVAAPLQNLAGSLNALLRNLANVLDQVKSQKEEGAAA